MRADRVGKRLKQAREERGLTQEAVREKIGAGKNLLSNWENGKQLPEGIPVFVALCRELRISADWALGLSEEVQPEWVPRWVRDRLATLLIEIDRRTAEGAVIPPGVEIAPPTAFEAVKRRPKRASGEE